MSTVQSGLFQLNAYDKYGDAIPATVRDIHVFADYHAGWIDCDFLYEQPRLIIDLDSDMGRIHADLTLNDITDGNLYTLVEALTETSDPWMVDVAEVIGETVYITPDEDFAFATLWPTDESTNTHDKTRSVCLRELGRSPVSSEGESEGGLGTEPRSLRWLNRQVRADIEQHVGPHHGWLEREIESVTTVDDHIVVRVPIASDWCARWEFDDSFKGRLALREFAKSLGLPADVDELEDAIVYVHLIRNLHHSLPRGEFPTDALERWVIAGNPLEPEPPKKSVVKRLLDFMSLSTGGVEVSVGNRTRHAKSSDDYDVPDGCRDTDSTESAETATVVTDCQQ